MAFKTLTDSKQLKTVSEIVEERNKTACTPSIPSYLEYLKEIKEQSKISITLGELEGKVIHACFTYNKDQMQVLHDLINY